MWQIPPMRAFNTALDAVYYDVLRLSAASWELSRSDEIEEGDILVAYPGERGEAPRRFSSAAALVAPDGVPDIAHVAVPGVGSSGLGALALAQSVADVVGAPVAGIVTGEGVEDFATEGAEGYFVLGATDQSEGAKVAVGDAVMSVDEAAGQRTLAYGRPHAPWIAESLTLSELFHHVGDRLALVVGHSKGAVIIANALALRDEGPGATAAMAARPAVPDMKDLFAHMAAVPMPQALEEAGLMQDALRAAGLPRDLFAANVAVAPAEAAAGHERMAAALEAQVAGIGGGAFGAPGTAATGGRRRKPPDTVTIVTFGRPSALPRRYERVWQFLGAADPLGWANRTFGTRTLLVPFAGHALNPAWNFHPMTPRAMPLERLLRQALERDAPPGGARFGLAF